MDNINDLGPILSMLISAFGSFFIALFGIAVQGGTFLFTIGIYGAVLVGVFAIFVARYILTGFAYSKMAEKFNLENRRLAWIPFFQQGIAMYLIYGMTGKKRLVLFDKYAISNGGVAIALWIGIEYLGMAAMKVAIEEVVWIPVVGVVVLLLSSFLALVPLVAAALLEYAYLRDLLNLFNEDEGKNKVIAVIVAIIDALIPLRLARTILLLCYLKKEPLTVSAE